MWSFIQRSVIYLIKKIYSRRVTPDDLAIAAKEIGSVMSNEELSVFYNLFCEIYEDRILRSKGGYG